jgi:hypothetical protein
MVGFALLLFACAGRSVETAPAPRRAVYSEYEYKPYLHPGTASITGQVFRRTRSGEVRYGSGSPMYLNPVTAYSTEWWQRGFIGGENLADADPRAAQTFRTATADGEGRFRFDSLPAGDYFIGSSVYWEYYGGRYYGTQQTGGRVGQRAHVNQGQALAVVLNTFKDF